MDHSSLISHHQDGKLSDSIEIGHRVPEGASHVCVAVSVEVLRHALVRENLHVCACKPFFVEIRLQGSFLLTHLHLHFRVGPPESGDLSRKTIFHLSNLDSCVLEVGIISSPYGVFQVFQRNDFGWLD